MSFKPLRNMLHRDLAMDLGTANTLVYVVGEGIVINEPTVIAFDQDNKVLGIGQDAKRFLGRTPKGIRAIRPMKDGVIEDFDAVSQLIRIFLERAKEGRGILSPRVVICVPSDITQVEKRAVLDAGHTAGAKKIHLLEETMAAAIGAGLPVQEEAPRMVVDIGGGTTEVAVIAKWAFEVCEAVRVAGDELDEAIAQWLAQERGVQIGLGTAESVKFEVGTAWETGAGAVCTVAGKDLTKGVPVSVLVSGADVRQAVEEPLKAISSVVCETLRGLPAGVSQRVTEDGILLTGGGALLRGMADFLASETGVACELAPEPLLTVALGAGKVVEDFKRFEPVFSN